MGRGWAVALTPHGGADTRTHGRTHGGQWHLRCCLPFLPSHLNAPLQTSPSIAIASHKSGATEATRRHTLASRFPVRTPHAQISREFWARLASRACARAAVIPGGRALGCRVRPMAADPPVQAGSHASARRRTHYMRPTPASTRLFDASPRAAGAQGPGRGSLARQLPRAAPRLASRREEAVVHLNADGGDVVTVIALLLLPLGRRRLNEFRHRDP